MKFSDKNIKLIVSILKFLYSVLLVIIILLLSISFILGIVDRININLFNEVVYLLINTAYVVGLNYRKPWLIPIILFFSTFGIIGTIVFKPLDSIELVVKILSFALGAFQIYFFTRKEVRKYFGVKGLFLFSK